MEEKLIELLNKVSSISKPIASDRKQIKYFANKVSVIITRGSSGTMADNRRFESLEITTLEGTDAKNATTYSLTVESDKIKQISKIFNDNENKNIKDVSNALEQFVA